MFGRKMSVTAIFGTHEPHACLFYVNIYVLQFHFIMQNLYISSTQAISIYLYMFSYDDLCAASL